ncbi:MAG: ZIP family metal transporter [Rubrobacter sp.]
MSAILMAVLAAAGFVGASLLALLGGELGVRGRSYAAAFAAGVLLALSFVELFPEALELGERIAIAGFVGGFALMFLTEAFTRAHTHHAPGERVHKHALWPFAVGLAIHNLADGFVLGVGARADEITSWLVGLGVVVHQVPVGVSLAAVFLAAGASNARIVRTAGLLGLAIPLAATLTAVLPVPGEGTLGFLTGVAGGVLAYVGAAHLLPEVQAEHGSRGIGVFFTATLLATAGALVLLHG